ncbi:MAG: hypothetical protein H7246_02695 [Phycisphaerae bacterium]|nr:hypothetical protein [Saprospiraceae bacterium]
MANPPSFLHRLLNWNKKSAPETVDAEQYAEAFGQFKNLLLEQYQIRIQAKTAKRLPINLTAKPTHFGTSPERAALYFDDLTIESEDIATEIDKILNTHQRLLLIGDPGAGKTTILLFAAINILMDERREQKLPLILNLTTWRKREINGQETNFAKWYAESIIHTYRLSRDFVYTLIKRNAVVPFFDGFDEVAEESREDCFQKMGAYFGDQRNRQLIVSSRKIEYAAAKADAPVYAEIEVQPLSLEQIRKALKGNAQTQAGDRALLDAIDRDEWLGKAVETPFYLNTASFLFGKRQRTLADLPFKAESIEGRQEELVEMFVAEQMPEERDRTYLAFLAGKMEEENFLVFELLSMQPKWCGRILWYRLLLTMVVGIAFGFALGLYGSLSGFEGLGGELSRWGLFLGFLGFFISWQSVSSEDIHTWSWIKLRSRWKVVLFSVLLLGLLGGIAGGLIDGLNSSWSVGLVIGLVGGAVLGLVLGLQIAGTIVNFWLHLHNPYQRFWASLRNNAWIIPTMILMMTIAFLILYILRESLYKEILLMMQDSHFVLLIVSLVVSMLLLTPIILSPFLNHFALRLVLYFENKLPLRLVTFLDRMTDQHIFEDNRRTIKGKKQRGAIWRFRHKILQDYFAKMPDDPSYGLES